MDHKFYNILILPITQIDSYILFLYLILFSICDQRFAYFLFQLKIEIKKSRGLSSRIIFRNLIEDRDITFALSIFNKQHRIVSSNNDNEEFESFFFTYFTITERYGV